MQTETRGHIKPATAALNSHCPLRTVVARNRTALSDSFNRFAGNGNTEADERFGYQDRKNAASGFVHVLSLVLRCVANIPMNPERWQRIEELFRAALKQAPAYRHLVAGRRAVRNDKQPVAISRREARFGHALDFDA